MSYLQFNTTLLQSLGRLLRMTNAEIMKATGISNATWYRILARPDEITVQQLMAIANGLHIPARRFFTIDGTNTIGGQDDYIENPYRPCSYDAMALQQLINTRNGTTWQDVANLLGMTRVNLRNSLLSITRLPVARLLKVCEAFGIDPFVAIIDPNPQRGVQREQLDTTQSNFDIALIKQELASIMRELVDTKFKVSMFRKEFEKLDDKYESLVSLLTEALGEDAVIKEYKPIKYRQDNTRQVEQQTENGDLLLPTDQ